MSTRILMLEDEPTTRTALAFVVKNAGYDVCSYGSAEEAAPHLAAGDIDIAVLDVRLPGRHGDDFGRELHEKYPRVPILFLTAELDIERIKELVPTALVLRKPIDVEILIELLRATVSKLQAAPDATARPDEPPPTLPFPSSA